MSESNLTSLTPKPILSGKIHGSVVESSSPALSAEPETITEGGSPRSLPKNRPMIRIPSAGSIRASAIDERPYDAGIVIIDRAARITRGCESDLLAPQPEGEVALHTMSPTAPRPPTSASHIAFPVTGCWSIRSTRTVGRASGTFKRASHSSTCVPFFTVVHCLSSLLRR